jgi:hypothetical protein
MEEKEDRIDNRNSNKFTCITEEREERESGKRGREERGEHEREEINQLSGLQGMSSDIVEVRGSKSPSHTYYCDYNGKQRKRK